MSIRNKLSAMAGMESLSRDEVTDDLHKTIVENVFGDGDQNLSPSIEAEQQQVDEALADATTDVEESVKLVETYLEQEQSQEEAVQDLHKAVDGMEQLLMTEYTPATLNALTRHTERCAKRVGIPFTLGVSGMESFTPASVYLAMRDGLESLGNVERDNVGSIKGGYERLTHICDDVEKRFDRLLVNLELLRKRLKDNPEIKSEIALGEWNKWLDVRDRTPRPIVRLVNLMEVEYILDRIKVLDLIAKDDLTSAKAQELLSKDVKKSVDVSRERTEDGKNHTTWEFRFNTACFYFDLPNQNGTSLEALKVYNLRMEPATDRYNSKSKNVYQHLDTMFSELDEMISIAEDTRSTYVDWRKSLKTESGMVVSALQSGKVDPSKALAYIGLHNRFMVTAQRGIFEVISAYEHLFRAHI
ncbi:hypothetical protein [Vibrio phage VP4B]|uniref:Uncharacterized protein n=1 Tax=Vibrio phage VP4B TaxID=1262540 RepID=V9LZX1_9CAUD|nr:internal head protein [Vibrio phage VP4B]AGB07235.1 hypothetical protein [Vibrio phage VP4B]